MSAPAAGRPRPPVLVPAPAPADSVLLFESEPLLLRTVALTARSMGIAGVKECSSLAAARKLLENARFGSAILSLDDEAEALALIGDLRAGRTPNDPALSIAVLTAACSVELLTQLKALKIARILVKPLRARVLLETLAAMSGRPLAVR